MQLSGERVVENEVTRVRTHTSSRRNKYVACVEMVPGDSFFSLFLFPLLYFDLFRSMGPEHPVIWLLPAEFRRNVHPS